MKTNPQEEKSEAGMYFSFPKKIEDEDHGIESFENITVPLNKAEESIVLNYGCLFFELCS